MALLLRVVLHPDRAHKADRVPELLEPFGVRVQSQHRTEDGFRIVRGYLPTESAVGVRAALEGHIDQLGGTVAWTDLWADEGVEALRLVFKQFVESRSRALRRSASRKNVDTLALGGADELVAGAVAWGANSEEARDALMTFAEAGWVGLDSRGAGLRTVRLSDAGRQAIELFENRQPVWLEAGACRWNLARDADDDVPQQAAAPSPQRHIVALRDRQVWIDGVRRGKPYRPNATSKVQILSLIIERHPGRFDVAEAARALARPDEEAALRATKSKLARELRDLVGFHVLHPDDGVFGLAEDFDREA